MRGIDANLALEARRITAIDGGHIGSEGEIRDENDLQFRFGAGGSGLEAAVNSEPPSSSPASATRKLVRVGERIGIEILRRGNGIFARHPRLAAGTRARTVAGKFFFKTVDWLSAPVNSLGDDTAKQTAGPDQFIGCEQPPGLIGVDNAARDEVACHCTGVEAVATETARQPYAAFDFTDLRHAMDRSPEGSVP